MMRLHGLMCFEFEVGFLLSGSDNLRLMPLILFLSSSNYIRRPTDPISSRLIPYFITEFMVKADRLSVGWFD